MQKMQRKYNKRKQRTHSGQDLDGELRTPVWKHMRRFDNWVGVILISFFVLAWLIATELERHHVDAGVVNSILLTAIFMVIVVAFWATRRNRQRAIRLFKLKCDKCGHVPKQTQIAVTQAMNECQKCYQRLHA
jgi:hypothetical protein